MNWLARDISLKCEYEFVCVCEKVGFLLFTQHQIWVDAKKTNQAKIQAARENKSLKKKINKYDIFHTSRGEPV